MTDIFRNANGQLKLSAAIDTAIVGVEDPALSHTHRSAGISPSSGSAVVCDPVTGFESVIGSCNRQNWYKLKNYPQDPGVPDPRMGRILEAGELLAQAFLYNKAKEAGIWAGDEIKFFDSDNVLSGRMDMMVYIPGTTEKMVVECKTMSPYMDVPYVKSGKQGYTFMEPKYSHLPQLMSYMQWWLQFGVKYGALYYITRDLNTAEYDFEWANLEEGATRPHDGAYLRCHSIERTWDLDWITWGMVRERYASLIQALKENKVPPRDFTLQYDNKTLIKMAQQAGKGSQLLGISKTDGDRIMQRFRAEASKSGYDVDKHTSYMVKGDFACNYCSFKTTCWSSLGSPETPHIESGLDLTIVKAPIVEKLTRPDEDLL